MDYIPIGSGYKILNNEKAETVISDVKSTYHKEGYMKAWITGSKTERSLKKRIETVTDASAGWAQVSGGGKLEYSSEITQSETIDRHSVSFIIRTYIETLDQTFDNKTNHLVEDITKLESKEFYDRYGDSYIQSVERGGLVKYDYTFDEKQDQIINNLEAQLHVKGSDIAQIEQTIKALKESKIIYNNNETTISSVPPGLNLEKMEHVDQINTALAEFNDHINEIKDGKDAPAIIYNWVSYHKHPLLRNIPMITKIAETSKTVVIEAKRLRILGLYLSKIERLSTQKPYNLKNQILISNISYDCYEADRDKITEWREQIERLLLDLKENIFNMGDGADFNKVKDGIKEWLLKPISKFAVTHLLTHVVDPTRTFIIVGKLSYKFQAKALRFVTPTSYLYIDVAGEDRFKNQKLSIKIQFWRSKNAGYRDLFMYGINSNTREILSNKSVEKRQLIYIRAREILEDHIRIKLYTGEGSERKRVRDLCLLRIYVADVDESDLLGQIQQPMDRKRTHKSGKEVDSAELRADELEKADKEDTEPAPSPEEIPDEGIPEDESYESLKQAGIIIESAPEI